MQTSDCKVNILKRMSAKEAMLTSHTKVKFIHKIRILCSRLYLNSPGFYFMTNKKGNFPQKGDHNCDTSFLPNGPRQNEVRLWAT
jgi:hypothetical protein